MGLVCVDQAEFFKAQGNGEMQARWLEKAEVSFITALKNKPPADLAGETFFRLARVNRNHGKTDLAREHARRAAILRPDLH